MSVVESSLERRTRSELQTVSQFEFLTGFVERRSAESVFVVG